jgi:flavodoxin
MRAVVVYDSVFGNTEKIAQAIGQGLGDHEELETHRVGDVKPEQVGRPDLLVVGSPTRGFRATPAIRDLLKDLPRDGLKGVKVAAFDTRFPESQIQENRILAFFVRLFGYAAEPIANGLEKKGGELVLPAEGFYVSDVEGPLLDGELERAKQWAQQIRSGL